MMNSTEVLRSELAPSGTLRVGINLGNPVIAQPGEVGAEPQGVGPALGREFAKRMRLPTTFVTYETAGALANAVKQGAWDVAFLAIDPERARDIDFTDPYVHIEGTYMVPVKSPLMDIDSVDADKVRIAVGLKTAYDLFLSRHIQRAQLVRFPSSRDAIRYFLADSLEAVAGVRQPLLMAAEGNASLRVMNGNFMIIRQAAGVPAGRKRAREYLAEFIRDAKRSGFVADALKASGVEDVSVAP